MPKRRRTRVRTTVNLPEELIEEARDAAYCLPNRLTVSGIVEAGLRAELDRLRRREHGGKPFPKRAGDLKTGRPRGS